VVELPAVGLLRGALRRPASGALAVRRHRSSSSRLPFGSAYHVTTE
jgi:hypothetical protein